MTNSPSLEIDAERLVEMTRTFIDRYVGKAVWETRLDEAQRDAAVDAMLHALKVEHGRMPSISIPKGRSRPTP